MLETKSDYRARANALTQAVDSKSHKQCSEQLAELFFNYIDSKKINLNSVAAYANDETEISVDPICDELLTRKVKVAFPVIDSKAMSFYSVGSLDDLKLGKYNIRQPEKKNDEAINTFDLILIPGRMFDESGSRIGRGAGYYDKFLYSWPCKCKVGVGFDAQILSEVLPTEEHDIKMNLLVSEKKIYTAN